MKRTPLAALLAATFALSSHAAAPADPDAVIMKGVPLEHVISDAHKRIFIAAADAKMDGDAWKRWADDFSNEMRSSVGTMFSHRIDGKKIVKGAPYSAEVVTEMNQQLPDGNAITRKTSGRVYRDGEGRTRQETGSDGKVANVHISDPVEGKRYISTQGKRTIEMSTPRAADLAERERERNERAKERAEAANERAREKAERARERAERGESRNRQVVRLNGTEVRIEDGKVFIDGKEMPPGRVEQKSPGGKTIVVENGRITIDGRDLNPPAPPNAPGVIVHRHGPDGVERKEVHVQTIRTSNGREITIVPPPPVPPVPPVPGLEGLSAMPPIPPMPPMAGLQTLRFESTAKLGKGVTTNLGVRDFDGVKAEGKSTVWTIPAGEIGNRNPIQVTSETWYSPELQVTVMSRYNDPRTGESVYRLANIQRAEPPAELFKPPEAAKKR
jgi:hypothetical protein